MTPLGLLVIFVFLCTRSFFKKLLWAIASKKNFINLHSATFVTVFGRNLLHAYKFRIFQKTAR